MFLSNYAYIQGVPKKIRVSGRPICQERTVLSVNNVYLQHRISERPIFKDSTVLSVNNVYLQHRVSERPICQERTVLSVNNVYLQHRGSGSPICRIELSYLLIMSTCSIGFLKDLFARIELSYLLKFLPLLLQLFSPIQKKTHYSLHILLEILFAKVQKVSSN